MRMFIVSTFLAALTAMGLSSMEATTTLCDDVFYPHDEIRPRCCKDYTRYRGGNKTMPDGCEYVELLRCDRRFPECRCKRGLGGHCECRVL